MLHFVERGNALLMSNAFHCHAYLWIRPHVFQIIVGHKTARGFVVHS